MNTDTERTPEISALTQRLDHSVPDGDFAPVGTER